MSKTLKTPPKPLTPQEQQAQVMRFFAQKREQFTVGVLTAMLHGAGPDIDAEDADNAADTAVRIADRLLDKLYQIPGEK